MELLSLKKAKDIIRAAPDGANFLLDIEDYIENLDLTNWYTEDLIKKSVKDLINHLHGLLPESEQNDNTFSALECIIFNEMNYAIMQFLRDKHREKDDCIYNKCLELSEKNVTSECFGAREDYNIVLTAPIVELSELDTYKMPQEKLICLCATYDMLFAELKTVLARIISKYSEKENDIPVVDNAEVLPLLLVVLVRSKLPHLVSSLEYIKIFTEDGQWNSETRHIFTVFEEATEKLLVFQQRSVSAGSNRSFKDLSIADVIKLTSEIECGSEDIGGVEDSEFFQREEQPHNHAGSASLIVEEEHARIMNLITKCTSTNQE